MKPRLEYRRQRQSERDCIRQFQLSNGVLPDSSFSRPLPQPFQGCRSSLAFSQGSSFLATLGFVAQSLWDSPFRGASADACGRTKRERQSAEDKVGRTKWGTSGIWCWCERLPGQQTLAQSLDSGLTQV